MNLFLAYMPIISLIVVAGLFVVAIVNYFTFKKEYTNSK